MHHKEKLLSSRSTPRRATAPSHTGSRRSGLGQGGVQFHEQLLLPVVVAVIRCHAEDRKTPDVNGAPTLVRMALQSAPPRKQTSGSECISRCPSHRALAMCHALYAAAWQRGFPRSDIAAARRGTRIPDPDGSEGPRKGTEKCWPGPARYGLEARHRGRRSGAVAAASSRLN